VDRRSLPLATEAERAGDPNVSDLKRSPSKTIERKKTFWKETEKHVTGHTQKIDGKVEKYNSLTAHKKTGPNLQCIKTHKGKQSTKKQREGEKSPSRATCG